MAISSTNSRKIAVCHPTGNANLRAALSGLLKANLLSAFYTTLATYPGNIFDRLGTLKSFSEFSRRSYDSALEHITRITPWIELGRIAAIKLNFDRLVLHETGPFSIDAVYRSIDKKLANNLKKLKEKGVDGIYAYEDGALLSFIKAKQLDIQCLYDLPIGYWRTARQLMENESNNWPDWVQTLTGFKDSASKLANKDEELRLADRIFVASSFTAKSLDDYPGTLSKIDVIPYGFPPVTGTKDYSGLLSNRPLKLLFVGGLSQRKGIANLFAAVNTIGKHVELTVIGSKVGEKCPALDIELKKIRWIPSTSHNKVLQIMREHDVLVFPTLFEGFGLVITEAMAQGTPVITTDRSAGPDLIKHEQNGWLVKAGSTSSLQFAIEKLVMDRSLIENAGYNAMQTAISRPWEVYGMELANAIKNN